MILILVQQQANPSPLTRHCLSQLLRHPLEIPEGDVSGLVVVEEVENLVDVFPGVLIAHLRRHHVQELLEINRARAVLPRRECERRGAKLHAVKSIELDQRPATKVREGGTNIYILVHRFLRKPYDQAMSCLRWLKSLV